MAFHFLRARTVLDLNRKNGDEQIPYKLRKHTVFTSNGHLLTPLNTVELRSILSLLSKGKGLNGHCASDSYLKAELT